MVGVDEVGRGCWAGPLLVVAAMETGELPAGLTDSKLMTKLQREIMLDMLSNCCQFGEGWVEATEIDSQGLAVAQRLGVARALKNLKVRIDEEIIMDGKVNYLPKKFRLGHVVVDADLSIPIVSAASIYAKVTRDKFMAELAKKHPSYYFEKHVGYGTKLHQEALRLNGTITKVHRFSYAPVARFAEVAA